MFDTTIITGSGEAGERPGTFRIARRVARDRVLSTVDPQARHTHKTSAARRDGYNAHVAAEPESGLFTECALTAANAADGPTGVQLLAARHEGGRGSTPLAPLTWGFVRAARDSNPKPARSVVSHHPSLPVLLVPSHPRCSRSTAMSPVRVGHASLPVMRGMVAMWSQVRAAVARLDVWRHVAFSHQACPQSTRSGIWCSASPRWTGPSLSTGLDSTIGCTEASGPLRQAPRQLTVDSFLPTLVNSSRGWSLAGRPLSGQQSATTYLKF